MLFIYDMTLWLFLQHYGSTALISAVCDGDVEIVQLLLCRGADVNIADNVSHNLLHTL